MIGGLDHFGQRLQDLSLGMIDILQFVDEQIVQRFELRHCESPYAYWEGGGAGISELL